MKIVSYTALHYGKEFLEYAIRSVIDSVDEHWCLYTYQGSHGHRTDIPCPETRDELYQAARRGAGDKLRWFEGEWDTESQQRETIHLLAPDADLVIVVDADEIFGPGLADYIVQTCTQFRRYRVPMIHFFRSMFQAVLHDPAYPERVIVPNSPRLETTTLSAEHGIISHMGYSQSSNIVHYKWSGIHGHQNELRKDCDWFNDRFLANARYDVHPVGSEYWNVETVNPWLYMPGFMKEHPYAKIDLIP